MLKNKIEYLKQKQQKIKKMWRGMDIIAQGAVFSAITTSMFGGALLMGEHNRKEYEATINENCSHQAENAKLLEAVFDDNIEDFNLAVEKGGNLKEAMNKYGRNALMVAINVESYDVAMHILNSPELRKQIDYKQCDEDGKNLFDYIQGKIEYHSRKRRYNLPVLEKAQQILKEQLQEQNRAEMKGQARSNIKYDAFAHLAKNNGNTGL